MAKLGILAPLLIALLALTEASMYRTTITTTTIEEDNPSGSQQRRCREQIQRQQFQDCQRYLSQGRSYDLALRRMITNPRQQDLQQCCQQLRKVDEPCRCEAIKQMMREQVEQGEMEGEQMHEVMEKARYLPRECNLRPQECQIRAVLF